ncbi:hypothetical protein E4P39_04015 [Blastococcus sp. CT_GayMR19]|uniref:hypothetical protein n=1 Tax=Blastococcus sp. CT_GayMR19 TaxID=2559608 RepID=UPI00107382BF|nr:hypothetical protein [Blastococcus sp. CT_GayMR19]TFV78385.1 hypothetical protein E4P39_04015 [Blastococcus sp. CT_GayMR19]
MTGPRAPMRVARAGIALATWPLPTPADRIRYRAEFLADLHDLPPLGQLRFTAGVLSRTIALRAAQGASPRRAEEDAMTLTSTPVPFWRCRVFHWHDWVGRSTEDGGRYQACARCSLDRGPISAGPASTPPWPGDI